MVQEELPASKQDVEIRKAAPAQPGHCTNSCMAAGRRQSPNACSHGATLILPFSLAAPVTPVTSILRALPQHQELLSPGGGITECKHTGTPRYLRWEESAGPCLPWHPSCRGGPPHSAAFGGLSPAPTLMPTSPLCSQLSYREHPAVRPSLGAGSAFRVLRLLSPWVHFLGAGSAFSLRGGCSCTCPEKTPPPWSTHCTNGVFFLTQGSPDGATLNAGTHSRDTLLPRDAACSCKDCQRGKCQHHRELLAQRQGMAVAGWQHTLFGSLFPIWLFSLLCQTWG